MVITLKDSTIPASKSATLVAEPMANTTITASFIVTNVVSADTAKPLVVNDGQWRMQRYVTL